eukprot:3297440-Rhodomonas_salina.1
MAHGCTRRWQRRSARCALLATGKGGGVARDTRVFRVCARTQVTARGDGGVSGAGESRRQGAGDFGFGAAETGCDPVRVGRGA